MGDDACEYHEAKNLAEALIDCARYNDSGDAQDLLRYLTETPSLIDVQDDQGRTAMHAAAANGHMNILEALIAFCPTPDVPNHEGNTALHFAALNNQTAAARFLLTHGWRASARNAFGKTPIQIIDGKQFEAMELLLLAHDNELDGYTAADGSTSAPPGASSFVPSETVEEDHLATETLNHGRSLPNGSGLLAGSPVTCDDDPTALLGHCVVEDIE
ncbi:putative Ankyrin repeats (3 copies) putative Ankyrin repeat [Trypanosoma vivax]|uniref:Uncharacterized protein n=1 Tax=Trypanosoma vivax (strain Y486) TaxID=1055687 RepID=G0UC53_TRYVY|nr:hypothetical protein TRVL_00787 [Trypanosoma vivax]KAH8609434.1 putative Ankyrin repeats (3 copies) putative Ankyrin repeat [Trypanosoma vivax]CCC53401.1 conserved hypothetical protein [Trypanosoma vivax Y486]